MKIAKILILTVLFVISLSAVFAQNATLAFKDLVTAGTTQTYQRVSAEYGANYPTGTVASRYIAQFYKTGADGTINALDPVTHGPTGTNAALTNGNNSQLVTFNAAPATRPWNASGIIFAPSSTLENGIIGDKIFGVVFNSNVSIAAATKYMVFNGIHQVTSTPTQNIYVNVISTNTTILPVGWSNWITFAPPVTIPSPAVLVLPVAGATGLGYAGQTLTWTAGAKSAPTGYKVYFGTAANPGLVADLTGGTFATTYNTGSLTANTTYYWKVVPYNTAGNAATADTQSFTTRAELTPGVATTPVPADNADFAEPAFPYTQNFGWTPPLGLPIPTGYLVYLGTDNPPTNIVNGTGVLVNTFGQSLMQGTYYWKVVPYYTDGGTKAVTVGKPIVANFTNAGSTVKGITPNCPIWKFTVGDVPVTPDIPAGGNADVGGGPAAGGANVATNVDLFNGPAILPDNPALLVLHNLDNVVNPIILSYTGAGTTDLTLTVGPGMWWGFVYFGGLWHIMDHPVISPLVVLSGTGTMIFHNVNFDAKGDVIIVLGEGDDPLPVELSSFTAVLTSQYFINLTWVTESESSVSGYYVYRSTDNNFANATCLNASNIVSATNTSSQQTYTMTDSEELVTNQTYYYWLQSVEMSGSTNLSAPISATVTGESTPVLPEISVMSSAYPNPFRMGHTTNINVNIKAGETGTVTIYNILGQNVKSYKVTQGAHTLTWNAKNCASGIYFYKLSTPSMNTTKKLVIVN